MTGAVERFGWREFAQLIAAVKAVGLKMLATVDAAVVGVLKEPGFEGAPVGIELIYGLENIEKDSLYGLFCLSIIMEDCTGYPKDQGTVSFEENRQGVVAAHAEGLH
jgi:hypothetical protein